MVAYNNSAHRPATEALERIAAKRRRYQDRGAVSSSSSSCSDQEQEVTSKRKKNRSSVSSSPSFSHRKYFDVTAVYDKTMSEPSAGSNEISSCCFPPIDSWSFEEWDSTACEELVPDSSSLSLLCLMGNHKTAFLATRMQILEHQARRYYDVDNKKTNHKPKPHKHHHHRRRHHQDHPRMLSRTIAVSSRMSELCLLSKENTNDTMDSSTERRFTIKNVFVASGAQV